MDILMILENDLNSKNQIEKAKFSFIESENKEPLVIKIKKILLSLNIQEN